MKTNFKKICAAILTFAMIFTATIPALAAAPALDPSISVTGLQKDEVVNFYQVLERDETAESGWKLTEQFKNVDISKLLDGTTKEIDSDLAAAIVKAATTATATVTANADGVATYTGAGTALTDSEAGLYLALVVPTEKAVLYNPVFVSADYEAGTAPNVNTVDISKATGTYNSGEAKKQKPTVDKEMVNPDDKSVMVGQKVPFKITTTIPAYSTYVAPKFIITDVLSTGLVIADTPDATPKLPVLTVKDDQGNVIDAANYVITSDSTAVSDVNDLAGKTKFEISFTEAYLKTLVKSQKVVVEYSGLVTSDAPSNFNEMTNKATIKYSNNPKDDKGNGTHEDITYHYTFTLDGNIIGSTTITDEYQKTHKELVKTAVDKEGKPVLDVTHEYTVPDGSTTTTSKASPLEGATFELSGGPLGSEKRTVDTTEDGFIVFKGLDEGTYTLKETKAPAGYVKDNNTYTVVIDASYNEDGTLKSYTVTITDPDNNSITSSFSITTNSEGKRVTHTADGGSTILPSLLKNIKALALPSTGGIGTVIFYVVGAVLVLGASVLLVTRRRMQER